MDVTIVGAGAIGGTIGAYLSRADLPVRLVDRDLDHVTAMKATGLTIRSDDQIITVPVDAASPSELRGPLDVVLLAVKAQHTADAVRLIAPLLAANSVIVSLQNGLCERVIADLVGAERTIGCLVNFSADYIEPGVIAFGGLGSVYLGELDGRRLRRIEELRHLLSHWGTIHVTENIWGYLWGKMGYANMIYATALTDDTMATIIDQYRLLMVELATEIYEVAHREGVVPEPFDNVEPALYYPRERRGAAAIQRSLDALVERRRRDRKEKSGIWRDLAVRHRKTEVDQQIELASEVRAGYGLPMPVTRKLVEMIHELEDGERHMTVANVEELDVLRRTVAFV